MTKYSLLLILYCLFLNCKSTQKGTIAMESLQAKTSKYRILDSLFTEVKHKNKGFWFNNNNLIPLEMSSQPYLELDSYSEDLKTLFLIWLICKDQYEAHKDSLAIINSDIFSFYDLVPRKKSMTTINGFYNRHKKEKKKLIKIYTNWYILFKNGKATKADLTNKIDWTILNK